MWAAIRKQHSDSCFLQRVNTILFFNDGEYQGKLAGNVEEDAVEDKIAEVLGG